GVGVLSAKQDSVARVVLGDVLLELVPGHGADGLAGERELPCERLGEASEQFKFTGAAEVVFELAGDLPAVEVGCVLGLGWRILVHAALSVELGEGNKAVGVRIVDEVAVCFAGELAAV